MTLADVAHAGHAGAAQTFPWIAVAAVSLVAGGYRMLARRRRRETRGWSSWRTGAFLSGCGLLLWAVVPAWLPFEHGDVRQHMLQHLLIGMVAPIGLVLGAPVTLLLRSVPLAHAARLGRVLRSSAVHLLANPYTALALNLGGLVALCFTPLYAAAQTDSRLHVAVHVHFLAAGALFAWVIAGLDPVPHRPSVPKRLVVLGAAIVGHSVISQLLYAGTYVQIDAPRAHLRDAASIMYFGGDVAELLLAVALVATWRPTRRAVPLTPAPATAS